MGLLIPSPEMAAGLAAALDDPARYYHVERGERGDLVWIETAEDGERTVLTQEPETGWFKMLVVRVISWLPVEWML